MGIKVCANQGAGPFWGPERDYNTANFLVSEKYSSHRPLARMHWYVVWSNLGTRKFKFGQIKFLGVINGSASRGQMFVHVYIHVHEWSKYIRTSSHKQLATILNFWLGYKWPRPQKGAKK